MAIGTNWDPPNIIHKRIVPTGSSPTCYASVEGRRNRHRFLAISLSLFALLGISERDGKKPSPCLSREQSSLELCTAFQPPIFLSAASRANRSARKRAVLSRIASSLA